ncbi:MAG: tetratricopeptide repeat protein, partial [Pyrinomonadaceae bacterium]
MAGKYFKLLLIVVLAFFLSSTSSLQSASTAVTQDNESLNETLVTTLLSFKEDQSKALAFLNEKKESLTPSLSTRILAEGDKALNTSNLSTALYLYTAAKYVADEVNERSLQAKAIYKIGRVHSRRKDYPGATDLYIKSQQMYEELISENRPDQMEAKTLLSRIFYARGGDYYDQDDLKNAIEFYTRSTKLAEETGSKGDLLGSLYDLGPLYIRLGDYQKAKDVSRKSLSLSLELEGSKESPKWVEQMVKQAKANAWADLGSLSAIDGEQELGLEFLQKALDLSRNLDPGVSQKAFITDRLISIGEVYHSISEYKEALNYYAQAMKIAQDLNNKTPYMRVLTRLSALYEEQGDTLKANRYMERSLE